jgi:hypothetical protein
MKPVRKALDRRQGRALGSLDETVIGFIQTRCISAFVTSSVFLFNVDDDSHMHCIASKSPLERSNFDRSLEKIVEGTACQSKPPLTVVLLVNILCLQTK